MKKSFINELINKEVGNGEEKLRFFSSLEVFVTEGQICYLFWNYLGKLKSQNMSSYFKTELQSKLQIRNILRE